MTIIVLTDCPPRLRGDLTKWLLEINTGVYVGNLNPRVRDELWDRICEYVKNGRATMVYRANNEQHMQFRVHNTIWEPVDYDGLTLIRRPLPQTRDASLTQGFMMLRDGFSNAAHQQRARQAAKGKSAVKNYAVIDIETTGLNPLEDDIVEIAALLIVDDIPLREFSQLIRIDRPLPAEVSQLTGIADADLQDKGKPLLQVLNDFQFFIENALLVSHNSTFDQQFLTAAYRKHGMPALRNRFIDSLALARRKIVGVSNYKLPTLATHLGICVQHSHRALADCYTTYQLFTKLNEK